MKKILLLIPGFAFTLTMISQGNSNNKVKAKDKTKNERPVNQKNNEQIAKEQRLKDEHSKKIWEGTTGNNNKGPKTSKNQPAKVRAAFQRDYSGATNVIWSKYRGDWTATFGNGIFMSSALYHANGERRDTRTLVTRDDIPRKVLDSIFKRKP